ncbi:HAMP domain-containing protein [Myxococcota bacterium]|nr:HAMP domain-containing protein [Myxococcota bacterium]
MRLARKLALAFFAVIVVVLAINAFVRTRVDVHTFESDMRRDHRITGRALLPAIRNVWRDQGELRASALVEEANAGVTNISVRWVWLEEDAAEAYQPLVDIERVRGALRGGEAVIVDRDEANMLFTYLVPDGLPTPRQGALELAESLAEERGYVVSTILRATVTTAAIVVVCGVVAWSLGIALIGRPVDLMIEKLRRVGSGDFGDPLEVRGRDELTELAVALNAMCDQLAAVSSERLRAQEALRHAERLTTIGKLASGIAHELGTPLNVIQARAKMIDTGRAASVEECARVIREQCDRMTAIIRQLLDFARKRGSRRSSVDLSSMVRETCELMEPLAKKRDVELVAPHRALRRRSTEIEARCSRC